MKKTIYISLFTILGILLQFVLHGILEAFYTGLLVDDFSKFDFGLSWNQWLLIHSFFTIILLVTGAGFGFWQGIYWYPKIYDNVREQK